MTITAIDLRTLLLYAPETGDFTWRSNQRGHAKAGSLAGRMKRNGYRSIKIRQVDYYAHRLAFLYMTGIWPLVEVDHINGVRCDNRWSNLRAATVHDNRGNSKMNTRNTSGLKGVSLHRQSGLYRARIANRTIGYYRTPEKAHAVYMNEARKFFGEFANAGK